MKNQLVNEHTCFRENSPPLIAQAIDLIEFIDFTG
jgi:hypothetical protein